ncbi:MAG: hypothetical protein ABSA47_07950, partial [Verrucomicrobiota bacterium]
TGRRKQSRTTGSHRRKSVDFIIPQILNQTPRGSSTQNYLQLFCRPRAVLILISFFPETRLTFSPERVSFVQ